MFRATFLNTYALSQWQAVNFFQIFNFNIKMNQQNSILANKISSCKGLFQDKTVFARKSHERVDNQITRD